MPPQTFKTNCTRTRTNTNPYYTKASSSVEVGARALRVLIKNAVGREGQVQVCKALVCVRADLWRADQGGMGI